MWISGDSMMPMYVKLDIVNKGRIGAIVKVSKSDQAPTFGDIDPLIFGVTVADAFTKLAAHYRSVQTDKKPAEPKP
jgi:hypothetical protein